MDRRARADGYFPTKAFITPYGCNRGDYASTSGSERRKEMELLPRLCLGTIYILPFVEGLILLPEYGFRV